MRSNEVSKLAKTFSTACKDAVEKSKVKLYTAPIILSVLTILLSAPGGEKGGWTKIAN